MLPHQNQHLLEFLHEDLDIPQTAISLIQRQEIVELSHIPIILWKFGLVSLPQVNRIFEWIEAYPAI